MFCDGFVEVGGRVGSCVADVWVDECDQSSSTTGCAVLTLNCIPAEVWSGGARCEFGLLYTGDQDVVGGEEVEYLLTGVLYAVCVELEKMTLRQVAKAIQGGGGWRWWGVRRMQWMRDGGGRK